MTGCDSCDFWGVAPPDAPGHPWHDTSVFKHKFGGERVDMISTLDRVYDPVAYEDYGAAQRRRRRG